MADTGSKSAGRPKKERKAPDGMAFLGVRISRETYKRLVRAKARMEFDTGDFYGMGNLVERVLESGLAVVEKEMGPSSPELQD